MSLDKTIKLRPRSERISSKTIDEIKSSCKLLKKTYGANFKIKNTGHLIWIKIGLKKREYWSPTLSLELKEHENNTTLAKITHGPDPILWTLFVALHFVIALVFIAFGIISYSKWSLKQPYTFDIFVMITMVNIWLLLYFIARLSRRKGITQSNELIDVMEQILH